MKKFITLSFFAFLVLGLQAQTRFGSSVAFLVADFAKTNTNSMHDFSDKYPVYKQGDIEYVSVLALVNSSFDPSVLTQLGIRTGSVNGNIATLRIPLGFFKAMSPIPGVDYVELAGKINPMLDRAKKDSRVDSVHMGYNLPFPMSGKNVIIGITDWGFDYTSPMFYDTALQYSRILAAWDQFKKEGPAPMGYDYGTVYTGATNVVAAQCDTFNIYEYATHGTHVAGIAGGSGAGTIYKGVAFDAEFLMTTFLIDAAAVVDAFSWMKQIAENDGKRLVMNMSWGLYYMGHLDGTSLLSQVIDQMSDEGVVFVSSAGNNGDAQFHIRKDFASATDTMKTIVRFDSYSAYPKMWGQSVSMWGSQGDEFSIGLKILDAQNNQIEETVFYSTATADPYSEHIIVINTDTIFYNLAVEESNPANQRPHIRLRIRNTKTALYKVALYATSPQATVHFWNVIELVNGVGNWGSAFQAPTTGWTAGDAHYGIGEPSCTESVISVASHVSEYLTGLGTLAGGQISYFSSYGPIINGTIKPDISAPGSNICSSISSFTSANIPPMNVVETVYFNLREYKFVRFSGTSMSSPHVAGVVALMLEANPWLSPAEIKQIIKETARQDDKTGVIPPEGSTRWGQGKVHALMAVYEAANYQNIIPHQNITELKVYPNPALNSVCLLNTQENKMTVHVYSINGSLVDVLNIVEDNLCFSVEHYSPGTYLVFVQDGKIWKSTKFIKL